MNKLGGLIVVGIIAGWGASRLMGSKGYSVQEKVKGRAEHLKGRVEQVVGKATGSEETQARGAVDEAKGTAREKVVEIKTSTRAALEEATA